MFLALALNVLSIFQVAKDQPRVLTEGIQFKLTYKVTAGILIFASSLLSLNDAFGKIFAFVTPNEKFASLNTDIYSVFRQKHRMLAW